MKVNELMIGDWVDFYHPYEPEKNIVTRHRITEMFECGIVGISGHNNPVQADHIEPIKLTSEILEKNGFIKDAQENGESVADDYHLLVPAGFESKSFTIQVSLYKKPICGVSTLVKCWGWVPPYNGGLNDIHLCSANYVHQFQHALRLCGIEKEIEL